jgi:tyrosine-protein phosphatase YwqE
MPETGISILCHWPSPFGIVWGISVPELIREIETQNAYLQKIKEIPQTDGSKLNSVLEKQNQLLKLIYGIEVNYLDHLERDIFFKTIFVTEKQKYRIFSKNHQSIYQENQPCFSNFWNEKVVFFVFTPPKNKALTVFF